MVTDFTDYRAAVEAVYFDWPPIARVLGQDDLTLPWEMEYCERATLLFMLQNLQPAVAVEVGTHYGGSLQAISGYTNRVSSLDIHPESSHQLQGRFRNVEFVVGDSKETLPAVLRELETTQTGPAFILIDGDHSTLGAHADLTNVLSLRPSHPVVVLTHDSFNPEVRAGILGAPWAANPFVHYVEIDFQLGSIYNRLGHSMEMWGGFALAILLPEERNGELVVSCRHELLHRKVLRGSAHDHSWRGVLSRKSRAVRRRLAV